MKPIHLAVAVAVLAAAGLLFFALDPDTGTRSTQRSGARVDRGGGAMGSGGVPQGDGRTGNGSTPALPAGDGALSLKVAILMPDGEPAARAEVNLSGRAALGRQLAAAGETLFWTLGAVAAVVLLGLLFAWCALLAESKLATRKTEFVSAVSHELRTPLTSIRMYADMLKEGWVKDDKTASEYFELISAESERLARLVNNVLDFSRIEADAINGEILLKVLDRGPGVPEDERESIFEAFTRGRNAQAGGSGLGLALVKHYAAAHRGFIEVFDRAGGGAVFVLHLPAA